MSIKVKLEIGFEEIQEAIREWMVARGVPATDLGALKIQRFSDYNANWALVPVAGEGSIRAALEFEAETYGAGSK